MKKWSFIVIVCSVSALLFAMPEKERFRRGAGMWEVFSQLDETARKDLLKLQREDPEAFRLEMEKRAEKLYQEKWTKRAELQQLIDAYQTTDDAVKKAEIKAQLTQKLSADFDQRLTNHRRQLEEMKRRTAYFEEKLEKRAAEKEKIIEKLAQDFLSGEKKLMKVHRVNLPPRPPMKNKKKGVE
ncbi:MAG: hypothetical protein MJ033_07400 [Victivallaceae bacterium]|nr:hypothetical protein [Victivallaceae bacterium]